MIRAMATLTNRIPELARWGRNLALAVATQERGEDVGPGFVRRCSLARCSGSLGLLVLRHVTVVPPLLLSLLQRGARCAGRRKCGRRRRSRGGSR